MLHETNEDTSSVEITHTYDVHAILVGLALERSHILDPAPAPGPLGTLAGEKLARLAHRWAEIQGLAGATRDLPVGNERADGETHLAPRWALLARGCAILLTVGMADGSELPSEERVDAAIATVALAARATAFDTNGFFSVTKLKSFLLDMAALADLPEGVCEAARKVALGLLQAGSRSEERDLLLLLNGGDAPDSESPADAKISERPRETSPWKLGDRVLTIDSDRMLCVDGVVIPGLDPLTGSALKLMGHLITQPKGLGGGKALGEVMGYVPSVARGAYCRLAATFAANGTPLLLVGIPGEYRIDRN